jgi:O-antigen/teichoic acid export membrane protein
MIARKSFLIVTLSFLSDFLAWIGIVILAKLWGSFAPEALGVIGFAISFVGIFQIVSDLGFSSAHIKRVSEGNDLGKCIGTFITIKLILTGLMALGIFLIIFIMQNVFNTGFYDATTTSVISVIIFYSIFEKLQSIPLCTFAGTGEFAKYQISKLFENIVKTPLAIVVALAGVSAIGYSIKPAVTWPDFLHPLQKFISEHAYGSLALTYVIGAAAVFFVGLFFMRKYPIKRPDLALGKSYLTFAFPVMITSIVGTISTNIDKVMIGYFWTSVEVGYYFTIQRVLVFINIFYLSIGTVLFPTISNYYAKKNFSKIKETTKLAERYISMVIIPPVFFVLIFANPFIKILLDSAFLPAVPVLSALLFWTLIQAFNIPYSNLVSGMNRPDVLAKINITVFSTNIILNFLIIPKNGILSGFGISGPTGAAVATVIAFLISFFGYRGFVKKALGVRLFQTHTPRHIIAGLIMVLSLYYVSYYISLFPVIYWYLLLLYAGFGLLIYLVVLFLLKEFNKKDLQFFLDIIHPKKMFKYVKSELKEKEPFNKK